MNVTLSHIDTCLPDYLQDHHNRDGELLLGVAIDNKTTFTDVKSALLYEFKDVGADAAPDEADFLAALAEFFAPYSDVMSAEFDDSIEDSDEDNSCESCYAWFLLSWDTETEDPDCQPND